MTGHVRGTGFAPPRDPAPRSYAASVTLRRRSARGAAGAPARTTTAEIEHWLLHEALAVEDLLVLVEDLAWRMVAAGLPLDRFGIHVGTLHPQLIGFAWNWMKADGLTDEVQVATATLATDSYRHSPLYGVIEHGETVRASTGDAAIVRRFPFLADLGRQGIADYVAMPIGGGGYHNAATFGTNRDDGFQAAELAAIERLLRLFALHVERHIALRVAANVLDTYLGRAAGARVLDGAIQRGAGEAIEAVIWVSDLRGFTDMIDRLPGEQMLAVLNAYLECLASAVVGHGGEVLKFIGDGVLAVFPLDGAECGRGAATASLEAAEEALAAVERLNADPPATLAAVEGWRPLRSGIALHEGEVFFGNVGAPERLDFTVIGRAVNEASRVEALCKTLGRALLITEPVARRLDRPLDDLGRHALRGLVRPLGIFSPAVDP